MPFVKVVKNKAYFKRYQTLYRRRREGRTDYHQRRKLVIQDKNKYQSHKYRFVVRFTNQHVICQVAYSEIDGDRILAVAHSGELPRYGLKVGLKNYPAAYCTGLLCARRLLKTLNMDSVFEGASEVDGSWNKFEDVEDADRRPFKCFLDVGLSPTKNGTRVFGAMKGAVDGGLHIPHKPVPFPGYETPEDKTERKNHEANFHPEGLRDRIFGKHIAEFMSELSEEEPERFKAQFAEYLKNGIKADGLEDLYASVHQKIRADPSPRHSKSSKERRAAGEFGKYPKKPNQSKLSLEERKQRVQEKKTRRVQALLAAREEESDDE